MRIIAFINKDSNPAYHRVLMPLVMMENTHVFVTNNLLDEHFENGCDIFMYNREAVESHYDEILKRKEKYGFKICVDVDDFWELDPHHFSFDEYIQYGYAEIQIKHIRNADVVFTTNSRLAQEIKSYNKNVHVLPNAIPKVGQFDIERIPHHLTRLFWQGSLTHEEDIKLLQRPIECLNTIAGKIKMVMAGVELDPDERIDENGQITHLAHSDVWYNMVLDYTAKAKHQYLLIKGAHVTEYYKAYANADICLIPLLNSPFNKMKSNLKVLEAANLHLPVICSQVHPYMDLPVLYARNSSDWVHHIQRLVASRKRQRDAGEELAEFVAKHFDFFKINKERKQILQYEAYKIYV